MDSFKCGNLHKWDTQLSAAQLHSMRLYPTVFYRYVRMESSTGLRLIYEFKYRRTEYGIVSQIDLLNKGTGTGYTRAYNKSLICPNDVL